MNIVKNDNVGFFAIFFVQFLSLLLQLIVLLLL